jgi:hypothetical protein
MPIVPPRVIALAFALSILLAPAPGLAEEWRTQGEERFLLSGGFFLPYFDTDLGVDGARDGGSVNLERDLGFTEDVGTGWLGGSWRFARNHRLSVSYFRFVRAAGYTTEREVTIGDEIYPAGARLDTEFGIQTMPIFYSYCFLRRQRFELAGSIGVHWWLNDLSAEGSASIGNLDGDTSASASVNAPLPLVGFVFDYWPDPRWSVGAQAAVLVLNIDDDVLGYSGSFASLAGRVHYWFYGQLAVGGAVNWFSLNFDVDGEKWQGALDYDYVGPQFYVATRF